VLCPGLADEISHFFASLTWIPSSRLRERYVTSSQKYVRVEHEEL
jgi:hypothetical protein